MRWRCFAGGWLLVPNRAPRRLDAFASNVEAALFDPAPDERQWHDDEWIFAPPLAARLTKRGGAVGVLKGAVSTDGRRWANLSGARVRWVDLTRPRDSRTFERVEDGFVADSAKTLLVGPRGRYLVTTDLSRSRIRDLDRDDPTAAVLDIPGRGIPIGSSSDGAWLMIAPLERAPAVALWPLDLDTAMAAARAAVGRDLTPAERKLYGIR